MSADAIVALSLEAPPELLLFLAELLADLDELGSDAEQIAGILRDLALPSTAPVVDLGCGKGAAAIAIASTLRLRVLGVDLCEPFVSHAYAAATAAYVHHLCEFRHGPSSCITSSSAADGALVLEVRCFFFIACSPDGDDPKAVAAYRHERRPHHVADSPNDLGPCRPAKASDRPASQIAVDRYLRLSAAQTCARVSTCAGGASVLITHGCPSRG